MGSSLKLVKNIFANAGRLKGDFEGVTQTAVRISGQAKRLVPVDEGRLKNSIMYRSYRPDGIEASGGFNNSGGKKASQIDLLSRGGGFLRATAFVGTNVFYAPYVEFGTRRTVAQPFLRNAFQIVKNPGNGLQIAQKWKDEMKKAFAQKRVVTRTTV